MAPAFKLPRNLHRGKKEENGYEKSRRSSEASRWRKWREEKEKGEIRERGIESGRERKTEREKGGEKRETIESLVRNRLINSDLSEAWRAKILFNSPFYASFLFLSVLRGERQEPPPVVRST